MRFWRGLMTLIVLAAAGAWAQTPARGEAPPSPPAVGVAELSRLDLLPRLRDPVKVGCISSYDRTGGNDDGFSGRYSFVRKEGDGLVIADLRGPGCVYRIWTPTPTDDPTEFYFDGEATPRLRLPFRKLFDGTQPPFVTPVSGYGAGGFWTYLPLPYRQSLKIVVRAPRVQFYQVNFATYPTGHPVETFRPELTAEQQQSLERAKGLLSETGADLTKFATPSGARVIKTTRTQATLAPGKSLTLFNGKGGGRVLGLKIRPASALAGKDRAVLLRMTWDGDSRPAVLTPAGDFFGFSWGEPAARGLLFGTSGDTCYAWFPMPYDRSARIELVSERTTGERAEVQAEVITADTPRRADEGRFYALWRRENPGKVGQPHTFVDAKGRGHVVAMAQQAQGPESGNTFFFEGDDQVTLDGELTHHGTGSEDAYNGGWYDVPGRWDTRYSFPLSGCLDYKKHLGRTGAYRMFLTDAYSFRQSVKLTIEHAPTGNTTPTDYASVAYLYLRDRPEAWDSLPPLAERAVKDFDRFVYTPGWSVPVHAFSFANATLSKRTERLAGNEEVRFLSVRAEKEDIFGPHALALSCEVPVAGKYRVRLEAMRGPDQGRVQLFQNERAMGAELDLYAEKRGKGAPVEVGTLELAEGVNPVFVKLMGKNPASSGMGLDLITLQLERVK
ncbi:MAG: hypothetical protein K0Q72_4667 [Armatimonadetes bacterium]|nr:hypothetical protein [Armatimonadota bacterium]